jgi:hypothetical protein
MSIADLLSWIEQSSFASLIGGSTEGSQWVFPIVETLHVIAIGLVFGSIFLVDLRLLGVVARSNAAGRFMQELLPWTWTAFVCAVITGTLMFIAHATTYWDNTPFRWKFLFLALAGCNMLVFQFGAFRRVGEWDHQLPPPPAARAAGLMSICLWLGVILMGRWVGFT